MGESLVEGMEDKHKEKVREVARFLHVTCMASEREREFCAISYFFVIDFLYDAII